MTSQSGMTDISPELVERMVALVRDLHAEHLQYDLHDRVQDFVARTAAIVALLPEPADPDEAEAAEIVIVAMMEDDGELSRAEVMRHPRFRDATANALLGIKRGRELALSDTAGLLEVLSGLAAAYEELPGRAATVPGTWIYQASAAIAKAVQSKDGWIEWAGGDMPVDANDEVKVRYRGDASPAKGARIEWPVLAWVLNWSHDGEDDDIIAYRIIQS